MTMIWRHDDDDDDEADKADDADNADDDDVRALWPSHVRPLIQLAQETENNDLLVECLGTLANLTLFDLPQQTTWATLIQVHYKPNDQSLA
jgi:hypothetical protein